ncbi:hypothetical protein NT01EI_1557 [Edwardsiella ictaluri 93-146]|uniref:Uncharacterized protein n=1 Tax=Edwardsiella ictaluri (strain 93-146) TaxID=634503 RepID=C5B807_EDWI9|nr:hypothetical protein NT01EI_1557 [Edwardsiella ictaluri 93-146]
MSHNQAGEYQGAILLLTGRINNFDESMVIHQRIWLIQGR